MQPTVLITGASRGLGLATARLLAAGGVPLLLAGRGRPALDAPRVAFGSLDVADLDSVRRFAAERASDRFGAIVCNAGVQILGPARITSAGFEETFAANHLGHFLLVRLLLDRLEPGGRIVFVASNTHDPTQRTGMPAPDPRDLEAFARGTAFAAEANAVAGRRRYTTSKLCNVLTTYELTRRLDRQVRVYAFDPGLMPGTGLAREYGPLARWAWHTVMPALTLLAPNVNAVRTSARRLAALAVDDPAPPRGTYLSRGRLAVSSAQSHDGALARRLWNLSSDLAGLPHDVSKGSA